MIEVADGQRVHALHAVEAVEPRRADVPFRPCGLAEEEGEHQRRRQRHDAEEDAADTAPDHEIAQDAGRHHRKDNGEHSATIVAVPPPMLIASTP